MLVKPLAACTYFNSFRVIRCLSQCISPKIAIFTTFLFPLGALLGQSCNMLHGWKDNSMLINSLAECTYVSTTVSDIERDNCEIDKTRRTVSAIAGDGCGIIISYSCKQAYITNTLPLWLTKGSGYSCYYEWGWADSVTAAAAAVGRVVDIVITRSVCVCV